MARLAFVVGLARFCGVCGDRVSAHSDLRAVEVFQSGRQHYVSKQRAHEGKETHASVDFEPTASSLAEASSGYQSFEAVFVDDQGNGSAFMESTKLDAGTLKGLQHSLQGLMKASNAGCDLDITDLLSEDVQETVKHLTDLRGCYPYLSDPCPHLDALQDQLDTQMERNKMGNSGSAILVAPGFEHEYVIKNIKSSEVLGLRSALLKLHAEATAALKVGRFESLVTPVCMMATLESQPEQGGLFGKVKRYVKKALTQPDVWIVMRRARLDGGDTKELHVSSNVRYFDLKGPGHWDGKSWLWKTDKVKDRGFQKTFPRGLEIMKAGERCNACEDLDGMLTRDSEFLESMQTTDYSIFVQIHDGSDVTLKDSMCGARGRFPAVFKARDPQTKKLFILTLGLIDYGTTDVANPLMIFSTRTKPGSYRKTFQDMWSTTPKKTTYFTCYHEI